MAVVSSKLRPGDEHQVDPIISVLVNIIIADSLFTINLVPFPGLWLMVSNRKYVGVTFYPDRWNRNFDGHGTIIYNYSIANTWGATQNNTNLQGAIEHNRILKEQAELQLQIIYQQQQLQLQQLQQQQQQQQQESLQQQQRQVSPAPHRSGYTPDVNVLLPNVPTPSYDQATNA